MSGPGLIDIYRFLGGGDWDPAKAGALWDAAIDGADPLAGGRSPSSSAASARRPATSRSPMARWASPSPAASPTGSPICCKGPAFEARFTAKGRYRDRMLRTPVRLLTYAEPGLLGAAIAFQREWLTP